MSLLSILFLLSLNVYSQQDVNKSAKHFIDYTHEELKSFDLQNHNGACSSNKSSSPLSLYDKGNTLHGTKQQDQDGLSTCYANTASLIIKSYNPVLPTPSYLDIASFNLDYDNLDYEANKKKSMNLITVMFVARSIM